MAIRPCPNQIDCPGSDSPLANFSSESPDPPDFISTQFFGDLAGGGPPNTPPSKDPWSATACGQTFISTVSQLDADLQALAAAIKCNYTDWTPPGTGGGPPPELVCNDAQTCKTPSPCGIMGFTVPAGLICTPTLAESNAQAQAIACFFSKKLCGLITLSDIPKKACIDRSYSATITATGLQSGVFWSIVAGSLPPGLTLLGTADPNAVMIAGTPTAAGVYTITIEASDSYGQSAQRDYTITAWGITTVSPLPDAQLGVTYLETFTILGGSGQYQYTVVSGHIPDGMNLDSASGTLAGDPTMALGYDFVLQVQDLADGSVCTKEFMISVDSLANAYWTMEETGALTPRLDKVASIPLTPDSSPGFNNGTGKIANGLAITAISGNANLDSDDQTLMRLQGGGFSVWGWFRVENWTNNFGPLDAFFEFNDNSLSPPHFRCRMQFNHSTQKVDFFFLDTAGNSFTPASFTPVLGTFYFFNLFFDPVLGQVGYSINNGSNVLAAGPAVFAATTQGHIQIAAPDLAAGPDTLAVTLDEIGLHLGGQLTPTNVTFLYNTGIGRTWPL